SLANASPPLTCRRAQRKPLRFGDQGDRVASWRSSRPTRFGMFHAAIRIRAQAMKKAARGSPLGCVTEIAQLQGVRRLAQFDLNQLLLKLFGLLAVDVVAVASGFVAGGAHLLLGLRSQAVDLVGTEHAPLPQDFLLFRRQRGG